MTKITPAETGPVEIKLRNKYRAHKPVKKTKSNHNDSQKRRPRSKFHNPFASQISTYNNNVLVLNGTGHRRMLHGDAAHKALGL